jgi:hypothetical protein
VWTPVLKGDCIAGLGAKKHQFLFGDLSGEQLA